MGSVFVQGLRGAAPLLFAGKYCLQVSRTGSEELIIPVKLILLALVVAGPP